MKKIFTLLLLFSLGSQAFSQNYFPYDKVSYYRKGKKKNTSNLYKESGVKELREYTQNNPKKPEKLSYITTYNQEGNFSSFKSMKNKYAHYYQWLNDSQLLSSLTIKKQDTSHYYLYTYNAKNQLIEYKSFKRNAKNSHWKTVYEYNEIGLKTKETVVGKNDKLISKIEYDFYEDGQKKETRLYRKNGKLKLVYHYSCEPKGVPVASHAEELNYCLLTNKNEDGSFYEILETHVDGKIKRQIFTYNADTNMVKFEYFKPNGQIGYTTRYTYNEQGKTTSYQFYNHKGKLMYTEKYAFNEKGLLLNEVRYNAKGKKDFSSRNEYLYN